jgi:hypothetical protein
MEGERRPSSYAPRSCDPAGRRRTTSNCVGCRSSTRSSRRAGAPEADKKGLRAERAAIQKEFAKRNVEVYGAITVRTNGSHLAVAFRMEKERSGSSPKRWHVYWFKHDQERGFVPESSAGH